MDSVFLEAWAFKKCLNGGLGSLALPFSTHALLKTPDMVTFGLRHKTAAPRKTMGPGAYTACIVFSISDEFSLTEVKKEASKVGEVAQRSISEHELETRWPIWIQVLVLFFHWMVLEKFTYLFFVSSLKWDLSNLPT